MQTRLAMKSLVSIIDTKNEDALVSDSLKNFRVRTTNGSRTIETLSGANQQKVVLARLLQAKPKVILPDEATRGVDIGTKYEI